MTHAHISVLENQTNPGAAAALQQRITDAFDAGHRRVVIDLRAAILEGTSTVSVFCSALRRLTRPDATIAVVGLPVRVRRVLEVCDIDGVELTSTGAQDGPRRLSPHA